MTTPLKFQLMVPVPDSLDAPFAAFAVKCDEEEIHALDYLPKEEFEKATMAGPQPKWLGDLAIQLHTYLQDSKRADFDSMLSRLRESSVLPIGTREQRLKMREMVCETACGEVVAYSEIAPEVDLANQNVGTACGKNRIGVIVPCFRVVGVRSGVYRIGKYSEGNPYVDEETGLRIKCWFLKHEGVQVTEDETREMSEWECIPKS